MRVRRGVIRRLLPEQVSRTRPREEAASGACGQDEDAVVFHSVLSSALVRGSKPFTPVPVAM